MKRSVPSKLTFPLVTVVEASAGSGKTTALTQRLALTLISKSIPHNRLQNILAITFTNNAAMEMKQRVLRLLKDAALGRKSAQVEELAQLAALNDAELRERAALVVETILNQYSDFQVQTIDSFLARVFKASALEFGFSPGFGVVLDSRPLLDEAFNLMAGEVVEGSDRAATLNELADRLRKLKSPKGKFQWNPYRGLSSEVKRLYSRIISTARPLSEEDHFEEYLNKGKELCRLIEKMGRRIDGSPVQAASRFTTYREEARAGRIDRLIELQFANPPVVKGKAPAEYKKFVDATEAERADIVAARDELIVLHAREYFQPYIKTHRLLQDSLDTVRRHRGEVDLGDLILKLAQFIEEGNVPELYIALGERIYHYLIDEFQDTSPIQWRTLYPLIDNSLSEGGSLYVVGDTKQSIYGFRGADWRIMNRLSTGTVFASAPTEVLTLPLNHRSGGRVLEFVRATFHENVPLRVMDGAEKVSGLSTFRQEPRKDLKDRGFVRISVIAGDTDERPERGEILGIVRDCLDRGYSKRDLAILTPENEDVVKVSGWLNEAGHEFIPFSTLDIRTRKIIGELLMLLQFLDSPVDDLAFGTVILGDLMNQRLTLDRDPQFSGQVRQWIFEQRRSNVRRPLYAAFKERFPEVWDRSFDQLFSLAGYLPLYDLISVAYKTLDVFQLAPGEQAALVKLLEVVAAFEAEGRNSLKEFVGFAEEISEDSDWNIDVPPDVDAIRVMTIHKAKGLGFPVVITLLYDTPARGDGIYLDESESKVRLVRLVKKSKTKEETPLTPLFQDKEMKTRVDQLNKLYVAFTRASEEMYVVGVNYDRGDEPSAFLPRTPFGNRPGHAAVTARPEALGVVPLLHTTIHRIESGGAGAIAHPEETQRGEAVHRILARLEFVDGKVEEDLRHSIHHEEGLGLEVPDAEALQQILTRFLSSPALAPYFSRTANRIVLNESEFVRADGQLFRIDRLVVDPSSVTVIDYKTGAEREEYGDQVRNYMEIVGEVFPGRTVRGMLAYVDTGTVKIVEEEAQS